MRRIALTIPTIDRPAALSRALASVDQLDVPDDIELLVLVIDNSRTNSSHERVRAVSANFRWRLTQIHEPVPGVSAARNAGLAWARAEAADLIGFMDDDETLDRLWLVQIVDALDHTGADCAVGAVDLFSQLPVPWWASAAFELDRRPTDDLQMIDFGYTCGSIASLSSPAVSQLDFDTRFGLTGGEDAQFFESILAKQGRIVFAAGAIAYEEFEADRLLLRWWVRRWFRVGNSSGARLETGEGNVRLRQAMMGIIRISTGVPLIILASPLAAFGMSLPLSALRTVCRGAGFLASSFRYRFHEYSPERVRRQSMTPSDKAHTRVK